MHTAGMFCKTSAHYSHTLCMAAEMHCQCASRCTNCADMHVQSCLPSLYLELRSWNNLTPSLCIRDKVATCHLKHQRILVGRACIHQLVQALAPPQPSPA